MTGWKIPPPILRQGWRYGLAVGSVGVALGVALLFGRGFDIRGSLFLTAVALTAWFGGMLPGLTALLLSVVSLGYFFQPLVPYVELAGIRVPYRVLSLTLFASLALTVCWLSASRRRAEEALRESEQRWRNLTEALAVGMGCRSGWRVRLLQRTVDNVHGYLGERIARLGVDGGAASGRSRAYPAILDRICGRTPAL